MKVLRALCLISFALLIAAPQPGKAASATEINADANATLQSFVAQNPSARELGRKAAGVLVFPSVIKAGLGFGGEYGEGVLIVRGEPAGYHNIISASLGFQLGIQSRSVVIMFMTQEALAGFRNAYGWRSASTARLWWSRLASAALSTPTPLPAQSSPLSLIRKD
jgi:lipid-binding SYLF domain-containing protein